jgi:hypothetical protein
MSSYLVTTLGRFFKIVILATAQSLTNVLRRPRQKMYHIDDENDINSYMNNFLFDMLNNCQFDMFMYLDYNYWLSQGYYHI